MDEERSKRVLFFVLFSFGISWAIALIIYLSGGLGNSPVLISGTPITLSLVLIPTFYMWSPTLANILTRYITDEGKENLHIMDNLKQSWKYFVIGWFIPIVLTIFGGVSFFLLFPKYLNGSLNTITGNNVSIEIILFQAILVVLLAPLINMIFAFGEEFGWRGYLLYKLLPLGKTKALIYTGIIWGVWHWPLIAMGYNYGSEYIWPGFIAMTWFTVFSGIFLGYITMKAKNVWPAAIGHGSINATAGIGLLFLSGSPPTILGPAPIGFIGSIGWVLISIYILIKLKDIRITEL